jgi:short-subunit dehydrogenase
MSLPKPDSQATIVITGASSGIGTELAKGLARRGYPLLLVARRKERMDELAGELARPILGRRRGAAARSVRRRIARRQLAERLRGEPIAGLCNSAGFGTSGVFQTLPLDRETEEVVLNSLTLMELTHAALPGMVERGAGAVLNIASIAGFQPMPYMAVYSATKAFVQTFSEAVHEELHGTGVSVTVLCPGPVPTEWGEIANAERFSIPIATGVTARRRRPGDRGACWRASAAVVPGLVPKAVSTGGRLRAAQPAAARNSDRQQTARGTRPLIRRAEDARASPRRYLSGATFSTRPGSTIRPALSRLGKVV